jgi:very-short-patch-repair endonuclease
MRDAETHERARRNRRELTAAEAKLWAILRGRRYRGVKFRRQHAIGPYVVDFACVSARLVLEVDGASHEQPEQRAFDVERTAFLEKAGWCVKRLTNADAFEAGDGLYDFLDEALGLKLP